MNNKIIVVFEENNLHTRELIMSSVPLKKRFSDVHTLQEIQSVPSILKEYEILIDSTNGHKMYNSYLDNKIGYEIVDGSYKYLKTTTGKLVMCCPTISQLSFYSPNPSREEIQKQQTSYAEYTDKIHYMALKIQEYKNIIYYEEGLKGGIDFSNFVTSNSGKTYKLVNEIPEKEATNTVYITANGVEILSKLMEISNNIKF